MNDLYLWVSYSMNDGDYSYGCDAAVKIKNGKILSIDEIKKLLFKKVLGIEFNCDESEDIPDENIDYEREVIWEESCHWGRFIEYDSHKIIPKSHFLVLKNYAVYYVLDGLSKDEKVTFT